MRTSIILVAVALLTPSLAAYSCPSFMGPFITLKCCRSHTPNDCTNPSKAPKDLGDFLRLCSEDDDKTADCCVVPPDGDDVIDCHPAPPSY